MNDVTSTGEVAPDQERRRRRRLVLLAALTGSLLLSSLIAVGGSLAIFTSNPALAGNAFTTGTVVLGLNPASALLTSANMMPGDTVNGSLVVSNTGTAQLRYAMTSASTNADGKSLMTQITLTVKTLGTSCAVFDGTSLYSGARTRQRSAIPPRGRTRATGPSTPPPARRCASGPACRSRPATASRAPRRPRPSRSAPSRRPTTRSSNGGSAGSRDARGPAGREVHAVNPARTLAVAGWIVDGLLVALVATILSCVMVATLGPASAIRSSSSGAHRWSRRSRSGPS